MTSAPVNSESFPRAAIGLLDRWINFWQSIFSLVGALYWLCSDTVTWLWRGIVVRDVRLGLNAITAQVVRVGVRSISIVMLVSGSIGIILALQTSPTLAQYGQTDKVANLIGVSVFRELGPLVAAIVMVGFAGASIAAELGTMVVGEEIEALEAMGLNPVRYLVLPRLVATVISLLALAVISNLTAVFFGMVMSVTALGVPYDLYVSNTINQLKMSDFLTGLMKAGVFGLLLGLIACYNGLRVTGGAAGVGRATTETVVQTVIFVILSDLLFSTLFYALGWN
ncbi:MAG: ABC transporter permease [Phycisphaerae bacterium]|nr:ABC transporter permease [Phycisphaerae bacterium]